MNDDPANRDPLSLFDPVIAGWFGDRFSGPTHIQLLAWPQIAAGAHVLLCAPTGSGKTLAAFLWSINQLATGKWPVGETSVLYVSPLKALNNDIRTNLSEPLGGFEIASHARVESSLRYLSEPGAVTHRRRNAREWCGTPRRSSLQRRRASISS